jgi:putative ABC transport system permease protein
MDSPILTLSLTQIAFAFIPVGIALVLLAQFSMGVGSTLYALSRMLVQLLLVGYVLAWIFGASSAWIIMLVLVVMVFASSWISLRTVPEQRRSLFVAGLLGIAIGGGFTLLFVSQSVMELDPWYMPRYLVPLAGMVFANSMTSVSLAAERLMTELKRGEEWHSAKNTAFQTAMIPVINSLFAVGLVSLPGMMTGQILSGVSPLIAARYQIVVMCMIFASAGISTAIFIALAARTLPINGAKNLE